MSLIALAGGVHPPTGRTNQQYSPEHTAISSQLVPYTLLQAKGCDVAPISASSGCRLLLAHEETLPPPVVLAAAGDGWDCPLGLRQHAG